VLSGIVTVSTQRVHHAFPMESVIRVLSVMVPASVSGLIADVSIAGSHSLEGLDRVADHAGCKLYQAGDTASAFLAAATAARHDTILIVSTRGVPAPGFHHEIEGLTRAGVRTCRMRAEAGGVLQRLIPGLCPVTLVMAPRPAVIAAASSASGPDLNSLARALGVRRSLQTRSIVQPAD